MKTRGLWLVAVVAVALSSVRVAAQEAASEAAATASRQEVEPAKANERKLAELEADLVERQAEYDAALRDVQDLQGELASQRKAHEALADDGDEAAVKASQEKLDSLQSRLELAQERLELAIAERRAVRALIARREKQAEEGAETKTTQPEAGAEAETDKKAPAAADPARSLIPGLPATSDKQEKGADEPLSERAAEAESVAAKKAAEVSEARESAEELHERKANLEEDIALERQRLANSYQRHDNLSRTLIKLEEELFRELEAGKEFAGLSELTERRDATRAQLEKVSQEIQSQSQRVQELQGQLLGLQQEQILAAEEVKEKVAEAETARRRQWMVTITDYAIVTLPRVALIVGLLFIVHYVVRLVGGRLIRLWSRSERGTEQERRYRAQTLVSVFENAATTALVVIGTLTILDTLKVPVSTLLGGVAVVGLAVAFGAQNLIKDYFYGFMILLENQYKINDVVTINAMTGQVEMITLRITVLRDFEGKVYFIPNGQINTVINLTHEWSRVVLDIPVAYKENIQKVMGALLELAQELLMDPTFKDAVLREPELFGVEKLTDSAVVLRLCLITLPTQMHTIRREMLRRIKTRFDELGIEIPFPQQTVHYQVQTSPSPTSDRAAPVVHDPGEAPPPARDAVEEA